MVDGVIGAVAAVSVMVAKTKLGGLVRHQCVRATGVDLTLTQCCVDRRRVHMPSCFMNQGNLRLAYVCVCVCVQTRLLRVFRAGSASRG